MTLVLDTSVLIDLQRKRQETVHKLHELANIYHHPAHITFVSYFEFVFGLQENNPKNKSEALTFIENFPVLQTTKTTAQLLANLKYKYAQKGISLSLADLLLASLVIENNMTLVTRDQDFKVIEELTAVYI